VKRLEPLATKQAVSQQELDNAVASREAAQAQVEAQNATVDKAQLDLGYTAVVSPITGLVGTTLVRSGALVGRGESTLLTTVSQVDPILFTAGISEAEYLRLGRRADELRKQRGGAMVSVGLGCGQQREDDVVVLAVQQSGEEREYGGVIPIAGGGGSGVGGEAGIALIEEVVVPDAEHFAGCQGLASAYGGQAAAALAFPSKPNAVYRFSQSRVTVAGFAVRDDYMIGSPAELASKAVGCGGDGVFVVRMGGYNQQLGTRSLRGEGFGQQSLGDCQQEGLTCDCPAH